MNLDNKEAVSVEEKKPCTFCYAVRIFAIAVFLLTVMFYFFVESQKHAIAEKQQAVMHGTIKAEL